MNFNPLELQACGENNFTMKTFGLLAFRADLRARLVQKLVGDDALSVDGEKVSILFFSRIGENFFREAIECEKNAELDARLNQLFGLFEGFRWRRNQNGRLTQPAKWREKHINEMLQLNGKQNDESLRKKLVYLQNCLNTEPDIVLQWGRKLVLIEIKVLASEGHQQIDREKSLGQVISNLFDWDAPLLFLIGPQHGDLQTTSADCTFFSWETVANWFSDVPEISDYIQSFRFFYHGKWQSMVSAEVTTPIKTAYDLSKLTSRQEWLLTNPFMQKNIEQSEENLDQWHFSHLGSQYFLQILDDCKKNNIWPLLWIWIGRTGIPFSEKQNGRQVNPKWMVEDDQGKRYIRSHGVTQEGKYDEGKMIRFAYDDIVRDFNL